MGKSGEKHFTLGKKMNRVQVSCLGEKGRFGNQLSQYVFARSYADKYNCMLEIPSDWPGWKAFEIEKDRGVRPIDEPLPQTEEDNINYGDVNIDLNGFFEHQRFVDIMDIKKVKKWLTFNTKLTNSFIKPKDFYVACHLRHGDKVNISGHCTISQACYVNTCIEKGYNQEDIVIVSESHTNRPRSMVVVNEKPRENNWDFLYDFFAIMNANVLFRSNSTFSFWAGVLGNHEKIYSPVVQGKNGQHMICVDFVEGNHACLMQKDDNHSDLYLGEINEKENA